jgi:hypothetical protein
MKNGESVQRRWSTRPGCCAEETTTNKARGVLRLMDFPDRVKTRTLGSGVGYGHEQVEKEGRDLGGDVRDGRCTAK